VAEIVGPGDLPDDVSSSLLASMWIDGANAKAARVAPCLVATDPAPTEDQLAEARLILAGAVIRWSQAGSGEVSTLTAGPYGMGVDTRQRTGFNLWPSEITQLQDICRDGGKSQAFSVDTVRPMACHSPICSIYFGGSCSCGVDLAGHPMYETDV
jgi:hypothetical protein